MADNQDNDAVGKVAANQDAVGHSELDEFMEAVGPKFLDSQAVLGELKAWIIEQPDVTDSGYIDQINFADSRSVRLLWYKEDPFLAKVLAQAKKLGIKVSVEQRSMSLAQIDEAMKRIWDQAGEFGKQGFIIKSIAGVGMKDTGLDVEGVYVGSLAEGVNADMPEAIQQARQKMADRIAETAGAPVGLVESDSENAATRSKDTSPFWAGGYMLSTKGGSCSTGFSLKYSGKTYATTARHCRGTYKARDNSGTSYGSNARYSAGGGASLLGSRGAGQMFDGAWNNSTGYHKAVQKFHDVSLNDSVCTSGGNSGVHCYIKINNMKISFNDGHGSFSNIRGVQQKTGIAAIQGDSGGPVLMPYTNGRVGAVGMIQAVSSPFMTGKSCGSVHDAGANKCSKTVLFSSTRTIANSFGATLITG